MSLVFFSLGSNIEPSKNLSDARIELSKYFSLKKFSSTYQSPSAGFDGADFLNEVLCFETGLEVSEVLKITKNIEKNMGRKKTSRKYSDRNIDIDLILYDSFVGEVESTKLPHSDIENYNFVLIPLKEIAGEMIHPSLGISMKDLAEQKKFTNKLLKLD